MKLYRIVFAVVLLVAMAFTFTACWSPEVPAEPDASELVSASAEGEEVPFDFNAFLLEAGALFATLVGLNQFIMMAINILKSFHIVPDAMGGLLYKVFNGLAFFALIVQQLFFPLFDVLQIDKIAGLLAQIGALVIPGLILVFFPAVKWLGGKAYEAWKGTPFIGYSYSSGGWKGLFKSEG